MQYQIDEIIIEWDEAKNNLNVEKHKISKLIAVIYTERREAIRIISARVATAAERKIYYGKNS